MKISSKIINRTTEVNNNKAIYSVYGMDSEGQNYKHDTAEYDNFQEAENLFNSIELQDGDQKILRLQVVTEEGVVIFEEYLIEVSK